MVDILLAVYNGAAYLSEQLDSIIKQTFTNWRLIILDDCSTDQTPEIVERYQQRYPNKIEYYVNETNSGNAKHTFFSLLAHSKAEYVMTCDHDDVWLPAKVEWTMYKMKELESRYGVTTPILVHTDLKIVDERLYEYSSSMFESQQMDYERTQLNYLLAQNIVTGCTMMVNRYLLDLCPKFPDNAIMHDWWLALVASAFGKIGFVDRATILYRQHSGNQVGAKNVKDVKYLLHRLKSNGDNKQMVQDTYQQAAAFWYCYSHCLTPKQKRIVQAYATLPKYWKGKRIFLLFRYRLWKYGFIRKLGQIFYV